MDIQSHMMKTCRFLYRNGARLLLSEHGDIRLYTDEELASFLLFMHADPPARLQYLCGLILHVERSISTETGDSLGDLFMKLAACQNPAFRHFSLDLSEDLFRVNHGLARATGRLKSLTSIGLQSAGTQVATVLQELSQRSRLTDASIGFREELFDSSSVTAKDVDPVHLLRFSKNTLRELVITNWILLTPPTSSIYPNLTTLVLFALWNPTILEFCHAFPNLSGLSIYGDPDLSKRQYASRRARNRDQQLARGSWSSLKNFFGSFLSLYILAPICPIEHVFFDDEIIDQIVNPRRFREVLSDARPKCLILSTSLDSNATILNPEWMNALSERRDPQLLALKLTMVVYSDRSTNQDMINQALERLYVVASSLNLASFGLNIDAQDVGSDNEWLDTYMSNLDIDKYAHRIKQSTPSMKVVSISQGGPVGPERQVGLGSSEDDLHLLLPSQD